MSYGVYFAVIWEKIYHIIDHVIWWQSYTRPEYTPTVTCSLVFLSWNCSYREYLICMTLFLRIRIRPQLHLICMWFVLLWLNYLQHIFLSHRNNYPVLLQPVSDQLIASKWHIDSSQYCCLFDCLHITHWLFFATSYKWDECASWMDSFHI